ncbi:uncharacterized protein A4U43_C02F13050 [Asparagus officinalis]|uniref:Non-structural maintenance of chromosomes element 1 homolog n=1 Tax=Asparagus officinalis TaxID=4686 RepID=A0A5P1FM00_ASPOF|nr:uncharacterized protein LOC109830704 [Asparagus officinalis]ONK77989.1 uncharacterized protein A4U43_C02F13050 [Asparagus officinalis]
MSQLSWKHHALIQALLSRGPLKESEFHKVFYEITGRNPVEHQQAFNDSLRKINKELGYVKFELRGCRNQYDGKVYYGVVNTLADEQSKLGTKYSVPQIAFYKAIIEAIVQDITTQGHITNIGALNLRLEYQVQGGQDSQGSQSRVPAAFKSFSISQKEKTLNDLIQDQWLCYTSDGRIGLGVRSFLDLRSWFRTSEIPSCDVCNEAGVKAETCPNMECAIRMHSYCLKKKFSQRKVAKVCPSCSTPWPIPESYEGDEEETNESTQDNSPSNDPVTRKRLRIVKAEAVDAAANAPNDGPSQSGPSLRKRLRTCKAEAVDATESQVEETQGLRRSQRSRR